MSAAVPDVPFTELLRSPVPTTQKLKTARALHLRRRDDDDLVLMLASRAKDEADVFDLVVRILSTLLHASVESAHLVRRVLPVVLPWSRFLPDDVLRTMADEFVATAEAVASVNNLSALNQLLIEWRHTAEVYADPDLLAALTTPLEGEGYGVVPRPEVDGDDE